MARPTRLRFAGHYIDTKDADGTVIKREPERFSHLAPARDLDESDLASLSAADIKMLTSPQADGSKPLYVDATPQAEPEKAAQDKPATDKPAAEKGKS